MTLKTRCLKHWESLGISDLKKLKEYITAIFERHDHQEQILIDLYKMVFPEWDKIRKINGYPEVNYDLWHYICQHFQEFDHKHYPNCFPAGMWMNSGFSVNHKLSSLEISFGNCYLEYKPYENLY